MSDGEIPKAPDGDFLTAEQIHEFGDPTRYRDDTPEGVTPNCHYCGAPATMRAYTDLVQQESWSACCFEDACQEKWEPLPKPLPKEEPTP